MGRLSASPKSAQVRKFARFEVADRQSVDARYRLATRSHGTMVAP